MNRPMNVTFDEQILNSILDRIRLEEEQTGKEYSFSHMLNIMLCKESGVLPNSLRFRKRRSDSSMILPKESRKRLLDQKIAEEQADYEANREKYEHEFRAPDAAGISNQTRIRCEVILAFPDNLDGNRDLLRLIHEENGLTVDDLKKHGLLPRSFEPPG